MNLDRSEMTERMLAAIENPYTQIIGHPTGRLILQRDPYEYEMEQVFRAAAKHGVAMECDAYPDRLDLRDVHLRMAKELGARIVISTDSHRTDHLAFMNIHEVRSPNGAPGMDREEGRAQCSPSLPVIVESSAWATFSPKKGGIRKCAHKAFRFMARSVRHFLEILDELNHLNIEFVSFRENIEGRWVGR